MKENINKAFNDQINREFYSAYLYLSMSEWLLEKGWIGASHWMDIQYREEVAHAEGLLRWVRRHNGKVELQAIDKPTAEFPSLLGVFEEAYEHEQFVTKHIEELAALADKENDRASHIFLDWYIMEQVEEEENARDNILAIQQCGDDKAALIANDRAWFSRSFHAPEIPHLD